MLIENNKIETNDIVTFKLSSGEEIVAKFVYQNNTSLTVSKPIVCQTQMVSPREMGIAFAPYMISTEDDLNITFKLDHIVTSIIKTKIDIKNNYIKATSSIEVPKAGAIAGIIKNNT